MRVDADEETTPVKMRNNCRLIKLCAVYIHCCRDNDGECSLFSDRLSRNSSMESLSEKQAPAWKKELNQQNAKRIQERYDLVLPLKSP